jgi:hypothetical protein
MADVLPFGKKPLPGSPDKVRARLGREVAAEQNIAGRVAFRQASTRQGDERRIAAGLVVPARITMALDVRGLDGPEIDEQVGTFHGNPSGDIDRWEQALAVPSREQVQLLGKLTDFPPAWFYRPIPPGPQFSGPVWICYRGRRGCRTLQPDVVTEDGVLLYEGRPRDPVDTCTAPLPGMPAAPVPEAPPRQERAPQAAAAPRKRAAAKAGQQPTLPKPMPAHVRAELDLLFAARRERTGRPVKRDNNQH